MRPRGAGAEGPAGPHVLMLPLSFPAASPGDAGASAGEERSTRLGLQDSLVLGERAQAGERPETLCGRDTSTRGRPRVTATCPLCPAGFVQLPTSGRIYKVPSVSSDEIWL